MREFKFRAWIKKEEEIVLVELVDFNEKYITHEDLSFTSIDAMEPSEPECVTEFKDCIIMQYTGLKDINGKEIYEGDIIKSSLEINVNSVSEVIWSDEWAHFELKSKVLNAPFTYGLGVYIRILPLIIGNIYENPELMEGE